MYLPNTVGKRHKKRSNSFSATEIYGFEIALSLAVHATDDDENDVVK